MPALPGAGREAKNMRESVLNLKMKKAALANSLLGGTAKPEAGESFGMLKRKSINFEGGASPSKRGSISDAAEMQIENDRLKTTLMILSQKLKLKEEDLSGQDEK